MIKKEKLLVLAPHTDDESFGCGGLIVKTINEGGEVVILLFAKNYGNKNYNEFYKAIKILGVSRKNVIHTQYDDRPLEFDQIGIKSIIDIIYSACNSVKPTTVAIPFIDSFHQDHEIVGKASIAALRPHGYIPDRVLEYEQPFYGVWGFKSFQPNYYVNLSSDQIKKKVEALKCYKSQTVPTDMVISMAITRGIEIGTRLAEAYILRREIR